MVSGEVFDIRRYSVNDGPGIRTAVFFKGCPARCVWCHNPESQEFGREIMHWPSRCTGCGACASVCPEHAIRIEGGRPTAAPEVCRACIAAGRAECIAICPAQARTLAGGSISAAEVMAEIERDTAFYDQSGGGATFTGGEPLAQPEFLCALLEECRRLDVHSVVDTSGIADADVIRDIALLVDLWLFDVKIADPAKHNAFVGCSNQAALRNLRFLAAGGSRVWVRVPVIPGINDGSEDLAGLAGLLTSLGGRRPERVELLPYHRVGVEKYARLGRDYALGDVPQAGAERIERAARALRDLGVDVRTGG